LYNTSAAAVDMSGFYLTDNPANLTKWAFPAGTTIAANGFLIVWADEDQEQGPLHANFKLSGSGEPLYLLDAAVQYVDTLSFPAQTTDQGYARVPNGTGPFVIQSPTFNAPNNVTGTASPQDERTNLFVSPNPAGEKVIIRVTNATKGARLFVRDINGKVMLETDVSDLTEVNIADWPAGFYLVHAGASFTKLIVARPGK